MTTIMSDDDLSGQQSRIMNAMRANAQPSQQQVSPQDLLQSIVAGNSKVNGANQYFDSLKQAQTTQAANNLGAEQGIYAQMKEQVARGNSDAAAVDKAITDVAGDDPKIYAGIAAQLHADPEKVTPANVRGKVMKYAAEQGINPLSNQTAQANTQKTQMEIVSNFVGNTTDQNSYDRAKNALQKTGVNTDFLPDKFDSNYVNKMKFMGATPSAQLSAIMQQQQMALRGKIAGLDDSSVPSAPPQGVASPAPTNQSAPANGILNNTAGQTPAEKAAALIDDNALPVQPVKQPNETTRNYTARLQAWKSNPDIVAHLSEEGASGKDTIKYNNSITADAKQAINMHNTIAIMQQAQQQFQAGAFAPAAGTLIKYARAIGVPVSDKQIATLSNQQIFNKLQNDIIGQAAKAEGGASRLQSAFDAIKSSNPNIGMEPESLNTLFKIMDTKAGEVTDEQQAWNAAKKANPALSGAEFERNYIAQRANAQEGAGGKLPGYKGNPNTPQNNVNKVIKFTDLPKG